MVLNPGMSEYIVFGTLQHQQFYHDLDSVNVAGMVILLAKHLELLAVVLDSNLTFTCTLSLYQGPASVTSERFAKFIVHWIKTQLLPSHLP